MSIRRATPEDVVSHCDRLAQQGQRLRPDQSLIAALDADGTLWSADVAELLWQRLTRQGALQRTGGAAIARALRESGGVPKREACADFEQLAALCRAGRVHRETMVRVMLAGLAGMREDDLYGHAAEIVSAHDELRALGEGKARRMVDDLRGVGFRVIVVSGSPRWAVEVAVRPLGIEPQDVIAGQVAVVNGILTDGIIEPLPWGRGKVQSILRRFGAVPRVSMGNGLSDLPMLEATCDLRILVDPTDELLSACEEIRGATWAVSLLGQKRSPQRAVTARAGAHPKSTGPRPASAGI